MVTRIEVDAAGRARGVVYRDAAGADEEVRARVVVVACSCIESARLLLLSESSGFPHGLGNNGGQIGQNLVFSTLSKAHGAFTFAKDAARAETLRDHAPFLGRSLLDYYVPKVAPVQKAGALNFLFPSGGPIQQAEGVAMRNASGRMLWGAELKRALETYWHEQKQLDCETFGEYLPTPGTHVALDPEVKDGFGLPVARVSIDRHSHDHDVSRYLADRASELMSEAGADSVWQSNLGGRTMHLPMGACRMGADPRASATDRHGRLHEVPNVFVTDGAAFASSGGVPPTFTILANAFRIGAHIRDALSRRDL
jgi:choline dehydrogenase-like flavoprotein